MLIKSQNLACPSPPPLTGTVTENAPFKIRKKQRSLHFPEMRVSIFSSENEFEMLWVDRDVYTRVSSEYV